MRLGLTALVISVAVHAVLLLAFDPATLKSPGAPVETSSRILVLNQVTAPAAGARAPAAVRQSQHDAAEPAAEGLGAEPEPAEPAPPAADEISAPVEPPEPVILPRLAEPATADQPPQPARTAPVPRPRPPVPAEIVTSRQPETSAARRKTSVRKQVRSVKSQRRTTRKAAKRARKAPGNTARSRTAQRAGGSTAGTRRAYARKLLSHIRRHKRYPAAARRAGMAGTVRLAIRISASGGLQSVSVRGSSGHALLDRDARATARRASPYPRPPGGKGFSFTVALRYKR